MREIEYLNGEVEKKLVDLSDPKEQQELGELAEDPTVKSVTYRRMKGSERNMPCPCGSGKKYKNCCGV